MARARHTGARRAGNGALRSTTPTAPGSSPPTRATKLRCDRQPQSGRTPLGARCHTWRHVTLRGASPWPPRAWAVPRRRTALTEPTTHAASPRTPSSRTLANASRRRASCMGRRAFSKASAKRATTVSAARRRRRREREAPRREARTRLQSVHRHAWLRL